MQSSRWPSCTCGRSGAGSWSGPRGRYGSTATVVAEAAEPGVSDVFSQYMQDIAPHLQSFTAVSETLTDPVRQIAVLEAQLASARSRGASLATLQLLEGKLNAARIRLQRRQETDESVRLWRTLGMLAAATGIAIGSATTLFILTRAVRRSSR